MGKEGLCSTCIESESCIFIKDPPVWQCEEFSLGSYVPTKFRQLKTTKSIFREEITESE